MVRMQRISQIYAGQNCENIGLDEVYQDLRNEEILKKSEIDGHQNKEE